jgi:hypothetical protein
VVTAPIRTSTPTSVRIRVTCTARTSCHGTVKLQRGTTVVGKSVVRIRAGRSVTVRVKLLAQASISARGAKAKRVTASAPRGTRVSFV